MDPLRTISRSQKVRLQKLGATVSSSEITATPQQFWKAPIVGGQRHLLTKRQQVVEADRWVPDDAKIHIDLVNDRAWTEADGIVAIDTLLGADANTVNYWGATEYDSGGLSADGYVYPNGNPPALIGVALTKLLAGATARTFTKRLDNSVFSASIVLMSADGNDAVELDLTGGGANDALVNSNSGSLNASISPIVNVGTGAKNCVALTVTDDRFDMAVNGSDAVASILEDSDRPAANPFVAALIDNYDGALQSITIYDALPSTAGLSELSETGVTNTAPHDLNTFWNADLVGFEVNGSYAASFPAAAFAGVEASAAFFQSGSTYILDDEGNPVTWSGVSADAGLNFAIDGNNLFVNPDVDIGAGTYHFTVRATDPGGLYVEQQFTITVTA